MKKIGLMIGSLRKDSFSKKWADVVMELYPEGYNIEFIDTSNLPFYNEDFDRENNVPTEIVDFRNKVKEMDAFVFLTSEYNRSIPPVLKNAIDIATRPAGIVLWSNKPALILSHSMSRLGGFGANHHLRQVLAFVNMPTVAQPEVYLSEDLEQFDEDGNLINNRVLELLKRAVNTHVKLI